MPPANSLDEPFEDRGGVSLLWDALESSADLFGPHHPRTLTAAHKLSIALWQAGDAEGAIVLLQQALDCVMSSFGRDDPMRVDLLSTLGEIMLEQHDLERARAIHREVLEHRVRCSGADHPVALAAKGDLAAILFELGEDEEAGSLEREAFEMARKHLGKTHSVTCVLAWNRALSCERGGDVDSARRVLADELAWLLAADPARLDSDQNIVRTMLAQRLNLGLHKTLRICELAQ